MASQLDRIEAHTRKLVELAQQPTAPALKEGEIIVPRYAPPHLTPDEAERFRQSRDAIDAFMRGEATQTNIGSSGVRADELQPRDMAYMRHAHENAVHRLGQVEGKFRNQDVYKALLTGSPGDINRAKNEGEYSNEWAAWRVDMPGKVAAYRQNGNQSLVKAYETWIQQELAK